MEKKIDDKIKEKKLNDLISTEGRIRRNNIIEAEEISYNNIFKNLAYDQYGFVNNNKNQKKL